MSQYTRNRWIIIIFVNYDFHNNMQNFRFLLGFEFSFYFSKFYFNGIWWRVLANLMACNANTTEVTPLKKKPYWWGEKCFLKLPLYSIFLINFFSLVRYGTLDCMSDSHLLILLNTNENEQSGNQLFKCMS